MKNRGLIVHRLRKTPHLSTRQKERRVEFAKAYRRFDWTQCAFWDETEIELISAPNPKNDIVWDSKGTAYSYGKVAHPATFKFGAAITVHGATRIVPYTGTIKSPDYIKMIKKVIPEINDKFSNNDWTWVQDGAKPHVSRYSVERLNDKVPNLLPPKDWPPNSPDDNPIENVFGFIEEKVREKNPQSVKALERTVRSAWRALTPEYCASCISAIPKRLKQIIQSKGEYVYELND